MREEHSGRWTFDSACSCFMCARWREVARETERLSRMTAGESVAHAQESASATTGVFVLGCAGQIIG